jgi:hypothetical protein
VQRLADVVERAGDAARVTGGAEQLGAALEVLEAELEIALAPPHPAHLVERDRGLGLRRRDPRQPQHALERAERRLEVADVLVDRAEVVPQVDARRVIGVADAHQRAIVEPDRALVVVGGAGRLGGAPVAAGGLAQLAGQLEVARDVLLGRRAAALGPQLEPLRGQAMVVRRRRASVDAEPDQLVQDRVREAQLALADIVGGSLSTSHSCSTSLVSAAATVVRE